MGTIGNFGKLSSYPASADFFELLVWHMVSGTRPGGDPDKWGEPWDEDGLTVAICALSGVTNGVSIEAVLSWLRDRKRPYPRNYKSLSRTLFSEDAPYAYWRSDFERAYRDLPAQPNRRVSRSGAPNDENVQTDLAKPASQASRAQSLAAIGHMPGCTPYFTGRAGDLAAVLAMLPPEPKSAAVLVQGGPGMGKTELTKAVAHQDAIAARFGARRWFVQLETALHAKGMEEAIALAVGCSPSEPFATVLEMLKAEPGLLVLDNLETPWEKPWARGETEGVLGALGSVPGLTVLASFRGRENVGGALASASRRTAAIAL